MDRLHQRDNPIKKGSQLDLLLRYALRALRKHFDMEVAFISQFKAGQRYFLYVDAGAGFSPVAVGDSDPLAESYCKKVVEGQLAELIPNAQDDAEAMALTATTALPVGAHLSVPIWVHKTVVFGTLCCFSRVPNYSFVEKDIQTLHLYADFIGHALSGVLAHEQHTNEVYERILDVLDNQRFHPVYQPIWDIETNQPVGYEMLTRFQAEPLRPPDKWFEEAGTVGLMQDLEMAVIQKALGDLSTFPPGVYISFNLSPQTILTGVVFALFEKAPLNRIVLEITEHDSIDDYSVIAKALAPLRERGLRLAVDDAGAGYASFRHILKLKPDLIKMDASLVAKIDEDIGARALAAAIVRFAAETGSSVVAEGVEATSELDVLKALKVKWAQGFLLGRPEALPHHLASTTTLGSDFPER